MRGAALQCPHTSCASCAFSWSTNTFLRLFSLSARADASSCNLLRILPMYSLLSLPLIRSRVSGRAATSLASDISINSSSLKGQGTGNLVARILEHCTCYMYLILVLVILSCIGHIKEISVWNTLVLFKKNYKSYIHQYEFTLINRFGYFMKNMKPLNNKINVAMNKYEYWWVQSF